MNLGTRYTLRSLKVHVMDVSVSAINRILNQPTTFNVYPDIMLSRTIALSLSCLVLMSLSLSLS